MLQLQAKRAEYVLIKLKDRKNGRVGSVFKIAQSIQGQKNAGMEAHAIVDPYTGQMAVSAKEIKRVSLNYCKEVLTNHDPEDEV